jgi:hypothetical protein
MLPDSVPGSGRRSAECCLIIGVISDLQSMGQMRSDGFTWASTTRYHHVHSLVLLVV